MTRNARLRPETARAMPIAVVGMSARLPDAQDYRMFWQNLTLGRDSVSEVPRSRWDVDLWYDPDPNAPNKTYSRWGGFIDNIGRFEPQFFNMSPLEAEWTDPQHRLFLEEAWRALEDAGYSPPSLDEARCSVYVGCRDSEYVGSAGSVEVSPFMLSGNSSSILPARLSYVLNLRGPSVALNTACSSSLVAVHLACESIRSGSCDMAIAGGVALTVTPGTHVVLSKIGMLSRSGRCRSFDQAADGIVTGEGVGVVVLKAIDTALEAGDPIHAVILGSGINQDGATNGITSPSGPAQTALESEIYDRYQIDPATIGFVEAHGTGTRLGDPIELHALADAFRRHTGARQFCGIGSVKSNLGHLMEASGVVGLIKAVLCLQHRQIVPSLHCSRPTGQFAFDTSPFFITRELSSFPTPGDAPRRAAVSSFGFSGTNAHVVLEEAPLARRPASVVRPQLVPLSAPTEEGLDRRIADLERWLRREGKDACLQDVACTLQRGRAHFARRVAIVASDTAELASSLAAIAAGSSPGNCVRASWDTAPLPHPGLKAVAERLANGPLPSDEVVDETRERQRLSLLGALFVRGHASLGEQGGSVGRRLRLPPYRFEGASYWLKRPGLEPPTLEPTSAPLSAGGPEARTTRDARCASATEFLAVAREEIAQLLMLDQSLVVDDRSLLAHGLTSVLSTKLIARLHARCGVRLRNEDLLDAGTPRGLARRLELAARSPAPGRPDVPPERPLSESCLRAEEAQREERSLTVGPQGTSEETVRLSSGQQALWLLQQLEPTSTRYNVPCLFRVTGPLDLAALRRAAARVWAEHAAIRARVTRVNGEVVQVFDCEPPVSFVDRIPEGDSALAMAERLAWTPFDLERGALAQLHVLREADRQYLVLLAAHHIILDGSSVAILMRDLVESYASEVVGQRPNSGERVARYAEFVRWQEEMLRSDEGRRHREYWANRLAPRPEPLLLPLRRHFASGATPARGMISRTLSHELRDGVLRFSHEQHRFPFVTLLSALKALLLRYTQQSDLTVAVPVAGRPASRFDETVGYFVNLVCLRTEVTDAMSFASLAQLVAETHASAMAHAELPFAEVAQIAGGPSRGVSSSLAGVQFVYQNWISPEAARSPDGYSTAALDWSPVLELQQQGDAELSLEIVELGGRFELFLKYDASLFASDAMERFADHFERLLSSGLRAPQRPIGSLDLLGPVERYQLADEWVRTSIAYPDKLCLHQSLEAKAERNPDAIAVVCDDERLSYAALEVAANRLALTLRQAGVNRGDVVGVMIERSSELPIALFGVLKAGAAYLPIDPLYPPERALYMLGRSNARVLVVRKPERLPFDFNGVVIALDDADSFEGKGERLPAAAGPDDLAYVIFTSGSTGNPKGVMIEHRGIVNRLNWMQRRYPLGNDDVILQKTPYTFDVSVWELFWWSFGGARVCFLPPGAEADPAAIVAAIERHRVTVMHFVPSMLSLFLEYLEKLGDVRRVASLRQVFCSGEALTSLQVSRFDALLHGTNGTKLTNLYGPTEASVDVSYFDCSDAPARHPVPIGRPIDNMQCHVVNSMMQRQPVGVPGELCLSGVGLARGYLGEPELTAERFVVDPVAPQRRLYRTGDLARWCTDGQLEFLGRIDRQVKVRGVRVELAEVEAAASKLPGIRSCVAVAVPDPSEPETNELVLYWVGSPEQRSSEEWKATMAARLPRAMVPTRFVQLAELPLTAHGKLNVAALPKVPSTAVAQAGHEAASSTAAVVTEVLAELLGGRPVEPRENFFDIGCHSLLLARASVRLGARLGRTIPVIALFEYPTIESLARFLDRPSEGESNLKTSLARGKQQRERLSRLAYTGERRSAE